MLNLEAILTKIENLLSLINSESEKVKVADMSQHISKLLSLLELNKQKQTSQLIEKQDSIEMLSHRIYKFSILLESLNEALINTDVVKAVLRDIYSLALKLSKNKNSVDKFENIDMVGKIIEQLPYLIFWKDNNGRYLGANKAFANIAGFDNANDIIGFHDVELPWKPDETVHFISYDQRVINSGIAELNIEEPQKQANGKNAYLLTSKVPLKNNNEETIGILGIFSDITERKEKEQKLQFLVAELEKKEQELRLLAITDKLTGLLNRHGIQSIVEQEIKRFRRQTYPVSLLLLDIDHFKVINDKFGHPIGDKILQLLASKLQSIMRDTDYLVRWGGEEFLILATDTPLTKATVFAEKVRLILEKVSKSGLPSFTVSIGVSQYQKEDDFDSWYTKTDKALYKAKEQGRNQVISSGNK